MAFLDLVTETLRRIHLECGLPDEPSERIARVVTWVWRRDIDLDPEADHEEVLAVWRVPLDARARLGGVVATFDNLQWAGEEPLDLARLMDGLLGDPSN